MKFKSSRSKTCVNRADDAWHEYVRLLEQVPAAELRVREAASGLDDHADPLAAAEKLLDELQVSLDRLGDEIVFYPARSIADLARHSAIAAIQAAMRDDDAMPDLLAFAQLCATNIALAVNEGHVEVAQVISDVVARRLDLVENRVAKYVVPLICHAIVAPRTSSNLARPS